MIFYSLCFCWVLEVTLRSPTASRGEICGVEGTDETTTSVTPSRPFFQSVSGTADYAQFRENIK